MEVMPIPPHRKRKQHIHSNYMPYDLVHLNRLEKREMSHIMKLYEKPYHIETVYTPTEVVYVEVDEYDGKSLDGKTDQHR